MRISFPTNDGDTSIKVYDHAGCIFVAVHYDGDFPTFSDIQMMNIEHVKLLKKAVDIYLQQKGDK